MLKGLIKTVAKQKQKPKTCGKLQVLWPFTVKMEFRVHCFLAFEQLAVVERSFCQMGCTLVKLSLWKGGRRQEIKIRVNVHPDCPPARVWRGGH